MSEPVKSDADQGGWQPASIKLDDEERKIGGKLEDAQVAAIRADIWFRGGMVLVISIIFVGLNWQIISFIRDAFDYDVASKLAAGDRLVTTEVLMTLIAATVVQTGVGVIAILSYLFPKRNGS